MFLAIFTLHEDTAFIAANERVVARLDRVEVELLPRCLERQVLALAELVGQLVLVVLCRLIKVFMVLQCKLLYALCLLTEEDLRHMLVRHVLLQI